MRTTKKELLACWRNFLHCTGQQEAKTFNDVGGLWLKDEYAGWIIQRIENDGGAVSCPFGYTIRPKREMADTLRFAMEAVQLSKEALAKETKD